MDARSDLPSKSRRSPGPRAPVAPGVPSRSALAAERGACRQLARDDVSLVCWHRHLPPGLEAELEAWARRSPAPFDAVLPVRGCDPSAAMAGLGEPLRDWLVRDITALVGRAARVAGARRLRVWFGAVRTDRCRKFHVDRLRYRLVATYAGPGTEWVPEEAVDRAALRHSVECACDANKDIVRDPAAVRHAVAGDVVLMKGALVPGQRGAVHRSPPIEGTGRVRVVLIASTVEEP